ncbi:Ankyrin repeat and fibronectin type-III domain-containing protein 1 [Oopsacas minuta]|uniref:Ankyrin repeat and fibronectin type-III domain-containing protein 1 n=1 Tax=Oopsacas minuta TaxID=111878 RepID=A0AAV7JXA9_9METZ|nr:Ankyrin repeat and fibronectin type-III domain-containing protein 1 [Oopsacas minuta]
MASGYGSSCHLPVFCIPFPETRRIANSTGNLHNVNVNPAPENDFKIPTTLNTELYHEYSDNYKNAICEDPARKISDTSTWRGDEEFVNKIDYNLNNGDEASITQIEDSVFSESIRPVKRHTPPNDILRSDRTIHNDTYNIPNGNSNLKLSKLFNRFSKRRKSACDLREYYSDTEREVKEKNKGKIRWGNKEEKTSTWRHSNSREKLSSLSRLSSVDMKGYLSEELPYRRDVKGRRIRKSISFDYLKDRMFNSTSTPPRSRPGSQVNIHEISHTNQSNSISFISDDESVGSRVGSVSMLGRKQNAILSKLWIAVCQANFNRVKHLVETSNLSQSLFTENIQHDDLTLFDLSLLTNHDSIISLLAANGFRESQRYSRDPLLRIAKFKDIIIAIERQLMDLSETITSSENQRDIERRINNNENKLRFYRVVNFAIQTIGSPSPPTQVILTVRSNSSLQISWRQPLQFNEAIVTKYLIQWERRESNFGFEGEHLITNFTEQKSEMSFTIPDLCPGVKYFVCVFAANVKGWSEPANSNPAAAAPSNWREWNGANKHRIDPYDINNITRLQKQTNQIIEGCKEYCWRLANNDRHNSNHKIVNKLKNKGSAITRFFKAPLKFTRQVQASFYIGILVYTEHEYTSKKDHYQILLTPEGSVPIIQLDQSVSNSLLTDMSVFQWLSLVITQWNCIKDIVYEIAGMGDSNSVILRRKLLKILFDIQESLGLKTIGSLHYIPIEQSDGATIYCLVSKVEDLRYFQPTGGLKWSYIPSNANKHAIHSNSLKDGTDYHSLFSFMSICPEMVEFHRNSKARPSPGLYLSLYKLRTNMNYLSILSELESVILFPSVKIRENSNVSKEEWIWIQNLGTLKQPKSGKRRQVPDVNGVGSNLQTLIKQAWHCLRSKLGITAELTQDYLLYTNEIIELHDDISILFVIPPPSHVVTSPGVQDEFVFNSKLTTIPLSSVKLSQLALFHSDYFAKHTYVSCVLDLLGLIIGQKSKEAISSEDLSEATNILHQHALLNEMLAEMRNETNWIANVLKAARDQDKPCGVPFTILNRQIKMVPKEKQQTKKSPTLPEKKNANHDTKPGVIRVYPMYETGLVRGTSVKISCTHLTTSREIVRLVVQQLHTASEEAGLSKLELTHDQLDNFSLISSVGSKVRLLDDSEQPLNLNDPWKNGKLYVTSKSDEPTSTTV